MMMYAAMNKSIPGFVGGWNAYGRSNTEDASTRDILYDYSGNNRHIKLYNFAFSGMSGWNGYNYSLTNMTSQSSNGYRGIIKLTSSKLEITNVKYPLNLIETTNSVAVPIIKIRVSGLANGAQLRYGSSLDIAGYIYMPNDGEYELKSKSENYVGFSIQNFIGNCNITVELLPVYPGGLVSDGIDDNGICEKDFSLPDDYTIVTIRKYISEIFNENQALIGKSAGYNRGSFIFEYGSNKTYSFGQINNINYANLFSYQSKLSYNGQPILAGTATDSNNDKLSFFTIRPNYEGHASVALYDLRIYDHSLTEEELAMVKADMIANYEKNTGNKFTE